MREHDRVRYKGREMLIVYLIQPGTPQDPLSGLITPPEGGVALDMIYWRCAFPNPEVAEKCYVYVSKNEFPHNISFIRRALPAEPVIQALSQAFEGVVLGDGVALLEGDAMDNPMLSPEECKEYRSQSEHNDWKKIEPDDLREYENAFSFMDAEGMRFNLPAYLIADLKEPDFLCCVGYCVTDIDLLKEGTYARERFSLLNREQKDAVAMYIEYLLDKGTFLGDSGIAGVQLILEEYWKK